jgi:two-component system cell cycle response regulator
MTARVLIVDDIDANVRLLEARLTAEYFETLSARSGPEALELCATEGADVVLLDVMMPGMDGFEVCRTVKRDLGLEEIYVVILTAKGQVVDQQVGEQSGADLYLTKPFDPDHLLDIARRALALEVPS